MLSDWTCTDNAFLALSAIRLRRTAWSRPDTPVEAPLDSAPLGHTDRILSGVSYLDITPERDPAHYASSLSAVSDTHNQAAPPPSYGRSTWPVQNAAMTEDEQSGIAPRSFLTCVTEVAQLLGVGDVTVEPKGRHARHLAHAVRKPLLERASLPEEWFAPLMAAAVYDPDPSFCRWLVEPAVYAFGRRRVMGALVDHLRVGTDAERAGAMRTGTAPTYPCMQTGRRRTDPAEYLIPPWTRHRTSRPPGWRHPCGCSPKPPTRRCATASYWTRLPPAPHTRHPCTNYLRVPSHPPGPIPTRTSVAGPQQQTTGEPDPDAYLS